MPFTDPFIANPFPFAIAFTLPAINTLYDINSSLVSGVYTISWSGGGTLSLDFYNSAGALVTSASGTSSITVNLAQSVAVVKAWCTVAPISIVLSLSGLSVAPVSGVLTIITASGTPGLVGDAYVVLIGGGGSGAAGNIGSIAGGGGGSGAIVFGQLNLLGNEVLTVGVGGVGVSIPGAGNVGTATTFGSLTAPGGANPATIGASGLGGSPNGVNGGAAPGGAGLSSSTLVTITGWPFYGSASILGTIGGGGGGGTPTGAGASGGTAPLNAYGSGGQGGNGSAGGFSQGNDGAPGVCLVLI